MEENFVATLFKSVMINNDTYLFVPISVIEGKWSDDAGVFVDNLENAYYEMSDAILNINANTHFYGFAEEIQKIMKQFDTDNKVEAIKKYYEIIGENIYVGVAKKENSELEVISLSVNDLKDILNKSSVSPILIESQKLDLRAINLRWDESFVEEVAKRAYNLNIGARSLKTIIEQSLAEIKWQALLEYKERTVLVTRETVENPKQYRII